LQDALGACPVLARRGCQRVRRKHRVADPGATTNTSQISTEAERVLSRTRAKLSGERNVQQNVQHDNWHTSKPLIYRFKIDQKTSIGALHPLRFSTLLCDFVRFGTLLNASHQPTSCDFAYLTLFVGFCTNGGGAMRNLCPRRDNNTEFKSNALSAWQRNSSSVGLD
jgi:hypothetical protein